MLINNDTLNNGFSASTDLSVKWVRDKSVGERVEILGDGSFLDKLELIEPLIFDAIKGYAKSLQRNKPNLNHERFLYGSYLCVSKLLQTEAGSKFLPRFGSDCVADVRSYFLGRFKEVHENEPQIGIPSDFFITVDGFEILVSYTPHKFGMTDHFQFYNTRDRKIVKEPMPLSETGYQSWFVDVSASIECGGIKKAAIAYVEKKATGDPVELAQGSLF